LLEICNKTYHGDIPKIWLRGGIKLIPKKGDLGVTYREITLLAIAAKIFLDKLVRERHRKSMDCTSKNGHNMEIQYANSIESRIL